MFYDLNREWTKNLVVRFVLALILTFPGFITTCVGIYLLVRGKQPAKHWAVGPWVSAYGALYLSRKENFWVDVDRRLALTV